MRPPSPSFIFGSEVVGVTESRFSDKPVHTLPVFSLIRAAVSPPTTVVVLALMSVLTPVLTVDALMVEALVVSVRMVSPLCCAMSNRGAEGGDAGVGLLVLYVESYGLLVLQRSDPYGAIVQLHMAARDGAHDHRAGNKSQKQQERDYGNRPRMPSGGHKAAQSRADASATIV